MRAATPKKTSVKSSRSKAASNSFFANYITVFFVLAGTVALGSSTFDFIQRLFPDSCQNNASFNCVYGPFEIANVVGALLFIGLGYWLLVKCLHIASFKRLVFGALVAMLILYISNRYIFSQTNTVNSMPQGLYHHVLWSYNLVATLLGAAAVFVPFHLKSK